MRPKLRPLIAAALAGGGVFGFLRWLRLRRDEPHEVSGVTDVRDMVEEADLESFPASDPPSWTLGRETER